MVLEDSAANAAAAGWANWQTTNGHNLAAAWRRQWGSLEFTPDPDELADWLATITFTDMPKAAATATAIDQRARGAAVAAVRLTLPGVDTDDLADELAAEALADPRVTGARRTLAKARKELAAELAGIAGRGLTDYDDVAAEVHRVGSIGAARSASTARFMVNAAGNSGRMLTADTMDLGVPIVMVWAPERDACVNCLAYAGLSVPADGTGSFPEGLSYDPKGGVASFGTLTAPPLHPHCRCDLEPWSPAWGDSLPDSLRREAERSVLRGYALESEADTARRRAADQLLADGTEELDVATVTRDAERRLVRTGPFARPAPSGA